MKIAIFASLLGVEATGQSMAVAVSAGRLAAAGHTVTVLATDCGYRGGKVTEFVAMPPEVNVKVFPSVGRLNRKLYRSGELIRWMRAHAGEFDVLDVHGFWSWTGMELAKTFLRNGKPYVLTPHGTMTRYDWRKSPLRRKAFFAAGFGEVWAKADAIRFLSSGEAATSYYPAKRRQVVIPNGIALGEAPTAAQRAAARVRLGIAPETLALLFLGRMTHQKGVKETLAAFDMAAEQLPALRLFLVGPAEGSYGQEVLGTVPTLRHHDRVTVTGGVFGDAKYDYLLAADAFITLSHNEGLSLAHLEALSYGLPMILTESSNLDHLEAYGAGAITHHDAATAAEAILQTIRDPERRSKASCQARRLVAEKFAWDRVMPQLEALYAELVEGRAA